MIEVERYNKLYGDFAAVQDLSFVVNPGDVLGLVGPNGAGKTTTLRALAGILQPTSGTIRICGLDLATNAVAAKSRLAFIPDEPQLFDYLTVSEHLQFITRLYSVKDAEARIAPLLEELELTAKKDSLPTELSRARGCWSFEKDAQWHLAPSTTSSPCTRTWPASRSKRCFSR